MPGKYDYIIGEGGSGLSGGQLQRLEIARGIASNRPIMILDEPTSNLDSKNANIILNTLKNINLTLGTTIIIISHKQDIDKYCDNIIEINNLN